MADINPNALLEFARTITSGGQSKSGARLATVTRVDENGVAYVQLPGGEESPIGTTGATYNIGDVVSVSMYNGKLRTVDNITAPSVSERLVRAAIKPVSKAAELAKAAANEADKVATAINQHFWADDNGIHVTEADHDATTEHNILINSLGILLRKASNYLVSITQSAVTFYDGLGNAASNVVAQFGANGAQIGYADETHAEIDYHSMKLIDKEGDTYFHVSDLRDTSGTAEFTESFTGDGSETQFIVTFDISGGCYVEIDGVEVSSSDYYVGTRTIIFYIAPANNSVIDITYRTASSDAKAFTLGRRDDSGNIGALSYVEGDGCVASGTYSHAEGNMNEATNFCSHAEGYKSKASGQFSHASGQGIIAAGHGQTAIGWYNVADYFSKYLFIIGNGRSDGTRSNALTVDWDGNIVSASDIPWTTLQLSSGWAEYSTAWTPKYRKVGQMVEIRGAISPTSATTLDINDITFAILPQGCRPAVSVVQVCQSSGVKIWTLSITDSGAVRAGRLRTMNSTSYQSASTSEWLVFDVTFLI